MSEVLIRPANGLASLLDALQPRVEPASPPPDLEAIRAAAHAAGQAAGRAEGTANERAALAPLKAQLTAACTALSAAAVVDADALRPVLAALVRQLAEAVLLAELQRDPAVLLALAAAALAAVVPGQAATLVAHPGTLAALGPFLPEIATAADPALAPDCITVSGADFIIDTSLSARLADILGDRG